MLPGDVVINDRANVFVLTNPAMPGLVRICFDSYSEDEALIRALHRAGVPFPFKVEFDCQVPNPEEVENALQVAFGPYRVNSKRNLYQIEPEQAIALLRSLYVEETTQQVSSSSNSGEVDPQSLSAADQIDIHRPSINFKEMGILIGSTLVTADGRTTLTVVGPRTVKLGEKEFSMTAATWRLLMHGYVDWPGPYSKFRSSSGKFPVRPIST